LDGAIKFRICCPYRVNLFRHLALRSNNTECPTCGSSFGSLQLFSEHLELHDQSHLKKNEGYLAQYKRRVESAVQRNAISSSFGKRKIAELDEHIRGADTETVTKGAYSRSDDQDSLWR
jgi:hypothetical protein